MSKIDPTWFEQAARAVWAKQSPRGRTVHQFYEWFQKYLRAHAEPAGHEHVTFAAHVAVYWAMAQAIKAGKKPSDGVLEFFDQRDPEDVTTLIELPNEVTEHIDQQLRQRIKEWPLGKEGIPVIPSWDRKPFRIELVPEGTAGYPGSVSIDILPGQQGGALSKTPSGEKGTYWQVMGRADLDGLPATTTDSSGEKRQITSHDCGHDWHQIVASKADLIELEFPELWEGPIVTLLEPAEEAPARMPGPDGSYFGEEFAVAGAITSWRFGLQANVKAAFGFHNQYNPKLAGAAGGKRHEINTAAVLTTFDVVANSETPPEIAVANAVAVVGRLVTDLQRQTAGQLTVRQLSKGVRFSGLSKTVEKMLLPLAGAIGRIPAFSQRGRLVIAMTRLATGSGPYGEFAMHAKVAPRHYLENFQEQFPEILTAAAEQIRARVERMQRRHERRWPVVTARRSREDVDLPVIPTVVNGDRVHGSRPSEGIFTTGLVASLSAHLPEEANTRLTAGAVAAKVSRPGSKTFRVLQRGLRRPVKVGRMFSRAAGFGSEEYVRLTGLETPDGPSNVGPERAELMMGVRVPAGLVPVVDSALREATAMVLRNSKAPYLPDDGQWRHSMLDDAATEAPAPQRVTSAAELAAVDAPPTKPVPRSQLYVDTYRVATVIKNDPALHEHFFDCAQAMGMPTVVVPASMGSDSDSYNNGNDGLPAPPDIKHYYGFFYRGEGGPIHSAGCKPIFDNTEQIVATLAYLRLTAHANEALGLAEPATTRRPVFADPYPAENYFNTWATGKGHDPLRPDFQFVPRRSAGSRPT